MNVKWYHVMLFSLVPLAIAFAGVIGGSFHGSDSQKEHFAAPAPQPTSSGGGSGGGGTTGGGGALEVVAKNVAFDKRSLSAAANAPVTIRFNNQDTGVIHNFAVYRSKSSLTNPLASGSKGNLITGPASEDITFTTPGAGTYYYQCDVHPDTMNGSFIVR